MNERSTLPLELEDRADGGRAWQHEEMPLSFGPADKIVGQSAPIAVDRPSPSSNRETGSTDAPQQVKTPDQRTHMVKRGIFGKRAFHASHEWEGIVERVTKHDFSCRMVPLRPKADPGHVELTDFAFEDLSTENDKDLVVPGAVFYWTLGRFQNSAGTVVKQSLLRFRRLPPLTSAQMKSADDEAEELLKMLSSNGSHAAAD